MIYPPGLDDQLSLSNHRTIRQWRAKSSRWLKRTYGLTHEMGSGQNLIECAVDIITAQRSSCS
jgi:hypothetical protein